MGKLKTAVPDRPERDVLRELLAGSTLARLNLPPALEAGYQAYHQSVALTQLRGYWHIVVLTIALIGGWLFLSGLVAPLLRELVLLGFAGVFLLVAVVVVSACVDALSRHITLLVSLAATAGLLAMHVATVLVLPGDPLLTIAQFGVILMTVAVFSISNLLFRPAVLCVLVATLVFLVFALWLDAPVDWNLFGAYTLGSTLIGAIIGFSQEIRERAVYLQGRLLFLEKAAIDAMAEKLEHLSRTDALTGLANRRHFDEFIAREWAAGAREGREVNLLFIDVDFFKPYNDHYGHRAGDDCLAAVGRALGAQALRSVDFVARYGGEEFVAMFPGTDRAGLEAMAGRLGAAVDALAIPHEASSAAPHVTVSIGIAALVPGRSDTPEHLIRQADTALYRAKAAGRHRYQTNWETPEA